MDSYCYHLWKKDHLITTFHKIEGYVRGGREGGYAFKTHGFLLLFGLKAAASEVRDALEVP